MEHARAARGALVVAHKNDRLIEPVPCACCRLVTSASCPLCMSPMAIIRITPLTAQGVYCRSRRAPGDKLSPVVP